MRFGVLDVSTIPDGFYYYAASAGREWFIDPATKFKDQSIAEADLALLDRVFTAIGDLLEEPHFRHFTWIGSGLQVCRRDDHIVARRMSHFWRFTRSLTHQYFCHTHNHLVSVEIETNFYVGLQNAIVKL